MTISDRFEDSIDSLLDQNLNFIKTNKRIEYLNAPCAFDIETTSFYQKGDAGIPSLEDEGKGYEKKATMYAFVLGIDGKCVLGRTWEDFTNYLHRIAEFYSLSTRRRMIIYVHNLDFEFQFIKDILQWDRVFATDERKPLSALTTDGFEFRDSYKLSGYSLKWVGEHLHTYKVRKMSGDLDYSLFRHSTTPLTDKEKGYILNDGLVVMAYIQEEIDRLGDITKIPLTKTGYVRRLCRRACYPRDDIHAYCEYYDLMQDNPISSLTEYQELKRAFQGGFTHASCLRSFAKLTDVHSYDFTSSYPAVMVTERYPMGKGRIVQIHSVKELDDLCKLYAVLFDVEIFGLEDNYHFEHYLSSSKCTDKRGFTLDNGRIVKASHLYTTWTDVDYLIAKRCYRWERIAVANVRIYEKGYLPLPLVRSILTLYRTKTELKGVKGREVEYLHSKEQLNSCYGMCVTDVLQDEITYKDGKWEDVGKSTPEETIMKYNLSRNRFLSYKWGVWVTAYARRNLWMGGILNLQGDYVYSDTDSVKFIHLDRHKAQFDHYNENMDRKIRRICKLRGLEYEDFAPKTKEGKTKEIGLWDYEGKYDHFKTLGAKRYMVEKEGSITSTISGINKTVFDPWIMDEARKKGCTPFDLFSDDLYVDKEHTGKNTHSYLDYPQDGVMMDYQGNLGEYHEKSSVHLEKADYSFNEIARYTDIILGYKEIF